MPVYEYRCQTCGAKYEQLRRMKDADSDLVCPECASREVERLFSCFSSSSSGGRCAAPAGSGFG